MDINTLAKSIVDQATGDKPKKKIQPATAKRGHGLANHVWEIGELVGLMETKSILDGLNQTA
jgi:hypothetical protein